MDPRSPSVALFLFRMALNAAGGARTGQIFFEDAARHFQRFILNLHFLVAADTQVMKSRFVISGGQFFVHRAGFGQLRSLGHIMTGAPSQFFDETGIAVGAGRFGDRKLGTPITFGVSCGIVST